jgi:MFS family permease
MRPGSCRLYGGAVTGTVDLPVPSPGPLPSGVWAPERRRLTLGLVLTITLVAFESLAISTVLPVVSADLGGLGLYGWVFSAFFLGGLLGIVTAGRLADRTGTVLPFTAGLVLFAGGLVVGGLAPSMGVLVAARVGQGIGAGAIPAIAYVSVGRAYPAALRPRVFAVFSTAWVVPGILGPAASSGLAHALGWRAVFLALLPLVLLAGVITVPALVRSVGAPDPELDDDGEPAVHDDAEMPGRTGPVLVLIAGVAAVLIAAGGAPVAWAVALIVIGAPLAVAGFVRLVPTGTLALAPGIPAAVAVKGILTFAFFGADAYVSLTLHDVRGQATWVAGVALTCTTITWTAAAWVQERMIHRVGPRRLVQVGLLLVALGTVLLFGALGSLPIPVAVLVWGVGGFGIGLAYSPISVVVLGLADRGREGAAAASVQLCDVLGTALGTGVGGAALALGEAQGWAVASSLRITFGITLAAALAGVAAARRLPTVLPS